MQDIRRWSAVISFADEFDRSQGTITASQSDNDLQKEQLHVAAREAKEYLAAGLAVDAYVQLYKTTKAHGTVKDQCWYVWTDERTGTVRVTR